MSGIKVEDLTVAYNEKPALWDVDLEIAEEKLTAIVGPNGAGKSTLLKAVLGLIPIASGYVRIDDKKISEKRTDIAYVPQTGSVDWDFPTNVLDIVTMGTYGDLGWFKKPGIRESEIALEALKKVNMEDFAHRQISKLSGGQQQRVFLARALVQDAQYYFLDEPLKGVDQKTEKAIMSILRDLIPQGKTILVVHHDLKTLAEYFDEVILLNVQIKAHGPIESIFTEENILATFGKI